MATADRVVWEKSGWNKMGRVCSRENHEARIQKVCNTTSDISLELHMNGIYGRGPKEKVEAFLAELHKQILMKR